MSWKKEVGELGQRRAMAEKMGGEEKVARQHSRGKMDARARLAGIVEPGSFLEIGKIAGRGKYGADGKPLHPEKYCACTFPWYALVVFWNGSVSPCPQDFFNQLGLGNLKDASIADIWRGQPVVALREKMRDRRYHDLNPCATCDLLYRDAVLGIPSAHLKNFMRERLGK